MGTVYRAIHLPTKQQVAIKLISCKIIDDDRALSRLRQEIDVHKNLMHTNIVRLYGLGPHPQGVFVVMEYIDGDSLEKYVTLRKKLEPLAALEIASQVLKALHYANKRKIIHRDLKPANILLERGSGMVKIGDFGLAKFTNQQSLGVSSTGEMLGTPAYMAPEQVICSKRVDIGADIYSLGCILFYMLEGKRPYEHIKTATQLLSQKTRPVSLAMGTLSPELPEVVHKLVKKATRANPMKRYASPAAFYKDLLQVTRWLQKRQQLKERQSREKRASLRPKSGARKWLLTHAPAPDAMVETFISSAALPTVDPILSTFQQEMHAFAQGAGETIISSLLPEDEPVNEEQLIFATMITVKGKPLHNAEKLILDQLKDKDVLKAVSLALADPKVTYEDRVVLADIKNSLLLRGKKLTQAGTTLQIINDGKGVLKRELKKMSAITRSGRLNDKIKQYFLHLIECQLRDHEEIFRRGVEGCRNSYQLESFLENYPLTSMSIVKRYKFLYIIQAVTRIKKQTQRHPEKIGKLLDKFLVKQKDLHIRMTLERLQTSDCSDTILDNVLRERDLDGLLTLLKSYERNNELRQTAMQIHSLITAFLDPASKATIEELKVALNFIPANLRNKISLLVRRHIVQELDQRLDQLSKINSPQLCLKELLEILKNPRYNYSTITVFGFASEELRQRIESIRYDGKSIQQAFQGEKLPALLRQLLEKDRILEKSSRAKNQENCRQRLQEIEERIQARKPVNLLCDLVDCFKCYGQVNFSRSPGQTITGYQVAQQIISFYRNPMRQTISLSENIVTEIYTLVKTLIDDQRTRQMQKMVQE